MWLILFAVSLNGPKEKSVFSHFAEINDITEDGDSLCSICQLEATIIQDFITSMALNTSVALLVVI